MRKFLQILGLRTNCCNAKILNWHLNKYYCSQCKINLAKQDENLATKTIIVIKSRIAH